MIIDEKYADIKTIETIFKNKQNFHLRQAKIPIEEKIKILVELQKIAIDLDKSSGTISKKKVWEIF